MASVGKIELSVNDNSNILRILVEQIKESNETLEKLLVELRRLNSKKIEENKNLFKKDIS